MRRLKESCAPDSYLGWLHSFLLMDDTVLLATSRKAACHKLQILDDFCQASGMRVNQQKTKFMIINGTRDDQLKPLVSETLRVENCDQYVYLGSFFPQDGKITTAVKLHQEAKQSHMYKLFFFCEKSRIPFPGKDEGVPVCNDVSPDVQLRVMAI